MIEAVLAELEALGTEQTRKTYRKHGVSGAQYGVLYGDLNKLKKRLKVNHALALDLWASGVHDARVLATMIADPKQADADTLERWARDLDNYTQADALTAFAGKTAFAGEKMQAWIDADGEWIETAGWGLLAHLAMHDPALPDSFFAPYLARIEREIHGAKNRVRYTMNNALIAIGMRDGLEAEAVALAGRIGRVEVDHGETNCKTPDAAAYIRKAREHGRAKA